MFNKQDPWGALSLTAGWTLASSVGWAAGLAAGYAFTLAADILPWLNQDRFSVYAILISLGLTLGAAQWVVLRRYLPRPGRWITATLVGHLLCLILIAGANLAQLGGVGVWNNVLLVGLFGTAIGTTQWWILRRHYRQAGLWVLASAVGFQAFMWLVVNPAHSPGEFVLQGAIVGALVAAVPGAVLGWLVRQPLIAVS
jgi:hypothetical protein